jgi:hypothetical protein
MDGAHSLEQSQGKHCPVEVQVAEEDACMFFVALLHTIANL